MHPQLSIASSTLRCELANHAARVALQSLGLPNSPDLQRESLRSLGVDSLDMLKLALDLEDRFDVSISDDAITQAKTVDQAAALVAHQS